MQIPKISLMLCTLAACATLIARAEDSAAQAAAREALMNELSKPSAPAPAKPATTAVQPSPAVKPAPAAAAAAITTKDTPEQAAARAALEKQMETSPSAATTTVPAQTQKPKSAAESYPGQKLGLQPIEAPPLPIDAAKKARLDALLAKYKADVITPVEYHQQRAAILAE